MPVSTRVLIGALAICGAVSGASGQDGTPGAAERAAAEQAKRVELERGRTLVAVLVAQTHTRELVSGLICEAERQIATGRAWEQDQRDIGAESGTVDVGELHTAGELVVAAQRAARDLSALLRRRGKVAPLSCETPLMQFLSECFDDASTCPALHGSLSDAASAARQSLQGESLEAAAAELRAALPAHKVELAQKLADELREHFRLQAARKR